MLNQRGVTVAYRFESVTFLMQIQNRELDDINDIDVDDIWSDRNSEEDERNVEFFTDTNHIKLL